MARFKIGETVFFWHCGVMWASPVLRACRSSVVVTVLGRWVRLPKARVSRRPR